MTGSRPLLLVLDYPGRREEARIADLKLESRGFDVRYLLTAPVPHEVTGREYAASLVGRHGPFTGEVAAVLSYCMASPIAQELAAIVDGGSAPVPMILFDGEPATADSIEDQYRVAERQLAEQLGATRETVPRAERFDAAALSQRPHAVVAWMRSSLVGLGRAALGDGADPDEVEEAEAMAETLADFYLDWLVHLVAAHNASWPAWDGHVLHVMSRAHAFAGDWPGARSIERVRLDSPRSELLATADATDIVRSFLDRARRREPHDTDRPESGTHA